VIETAPEVQVTVARVRELVAERFAGRTGPDLGSVSSRVPGSELFVISPAALGADDPRPEHMLLCTLDGEIVPDIPGWELQASPHTAAHARLYRELPDVDAVALDGPGADPRLHLDHQEHPGKEAQ
jgi:L-ribulose-5-phosphate 4-epimerase